MKNYLYILCTFLLAFAGCTKDADVEPIAPAPDENAQVVLTGFSGRGTRTGFGGAEDGAVPFLWSAGDYIWASNTRSEAIAEGGSQATFIFESIATADTYDVFYNLTGPTPRGREPKARKRSSSSPATANRLRRIFRDRYSTATPGASSACPRPTSPCSTPWANRSG